MELPEIFVLRWRGPTKPRNNRIQSSIRKDIDKRAKQGQIVFVLTEDEKIYEWRHWNYPVFTSWLDFHNQYKDYTLEIK